MSAKRSLNVGVVGMGRMGVPITRNIAFKSRNGVYLQIHSRSLARAKEVCNHLSIDGAQCAMRLHNRYATVTKWCDVVVTALQDVHAARLVLLEAPDALVRNARPGQIIIDHTTVDVETARECAEVARQRGASYLDAPMSGNPQSALNGQLTIMAGGDDATFLKVLPLLRLYGETIHRMGESGSGAAAKAICQMLVAVHTVAAAEAMSMAHQLGVEDADKLVGVLDASWGSSTMLRRNAPTMQKLLRNPEKPPPSSSATVDALLHDVGLLFGGAGFDSASIQGGCFPLFHRSCNVLARTSTAGAGDRDLAGVVHFLDAAEERTAPPGARHAPGVADAAPVDAPPVDTGAAALDPVDEAATEFY